MGTRFFLPVTLLVASSLTGTLGCRTPAPSPTKQEVDDRPTPGNVALVDVSAQVDALVNQAIDGARQAVNPKGSPWTPELGRALVDAVARRLATPRPGTGLGIHWQGINLEVSTLSEFEARLGELLSVEKHEIYYTKFKDSRYGDNAIGIGVAKVMSHVSMETADHSIGPAIRIGTEIIGTDKLGHFTEQGYWYFLAEQDGLAVGPTERYQFGQYMEGDPALAAELRQKYYDVYGHYCRICVLAGGFGYFGMAATGVCSFADMNANESGYQFFMNLWRNPATTRFAIRTLNVRQWNEDSVPSKFLPGLKVRPDPSR